MMEILGTINMSKDSVYNGKRIADMTDEEKADVVKQMSRYGGRCVIEGYNDNQESKVCPDCAQTPASGIGKQVNNTNIAICLGEPDYRTRLKHKYAGMAIQGLLLRGTPDSLEHLAEYCHRVANILVEEVMR